MADAPRMVGLTGGIASGKSTVTAMFRELGAEVIDADLVAREVVQPGGPAVAEIAARFPGVVRPDGTLDRAALGARVFADPAERAALNAIVHPRIQEAVRLKRAALASRGARVVLYDAALLIENGLHRTLDGVILVAVPEPLQLARLMARDGLTEAEARARLSAQLPLADKLRHATWVVDNSRSVADTRGQVEAIWRSLQAGG